MPTGNEAFDLAVSASECQRQVAMAAKMPGHDFSGDGDNPAVPALTTTREIDIAHYSRVVAAGLLYGVATEGARAALRDLRA